MNNPKTQSERPQNDDVSAVDHMLIKDLLDSLLIDNDALRNVLTVSQVWQYTRMPDYCFGWTEGDKFGPMPLVIKVSLIIRTFQLGFTPGMGELIWLGNSPFITAAARAFCVSESKKIRAVGPQTFRPFTDAERKMFGIGEGDLNCVVEQLHAKDGNEFVWTGHGVIGVDELNYVDNKTKQKKIGMRTSNQIIQTLKTRAVSDMNRRNFPIYGLQDTSDVPDFFGAQVVTIDAEAPLKAGLVSIGKAEKQTVESNAPDLEKPHIDEKAREATHAAHVRFASLANEIKKAKGDLKKILGENWELLLDSANAETIYDASDVLEAWLEAEAEPIAETPAPTQISKPVTPTPAPIAAAPEKIARKAGRPSKAQSRFRKLETSVVEIGGVVDAILGINAVNLYYQNDPEELSEACNLLEAWLAANDQPPEPPTPPRTLEGALRADDEEKEPWDNGEPPADPLDESANLTDEEWKAKFPYNADEPDSENEPELKLEIGPEVKAEINQPEIFTSTKSQIDNIRMAADNAGLNSEALKHALITIMRNRPMSELDANIETLAKQVIAEKPAPAERSLDPVDSDGEIKFPTSGAGAAAYAMLNKNLYDSKTSMEVKSKIRQLMMRRLKDGDHLYLPKAIREAKSGSFKELDALISGRESRV